MAAGAANSAAQVYFSGARLYGDDFDAEGILAWYRDEEQAYFELRSGQREHRDYDYHALNARHGTRHLPPGSIGRLLSFGGASGEEVRPIAARASSIVIVDPTDYGTRLLDRAAVEYRKPDPLGALPAADREFDTLTCFGVLHHIPNVSRVLGEFGRVLRPGGVALIREPIVSMGDWRQSRRGLTSRERGIPLPLLSRMLDESGFSVLRRQRCVHPLTPRIARLLGRTAFNSLSLVAFDALLSSCTPWQTRYHARGWRRLQPAAAFFVLRKR
jgi:SAM-dependent methyltransferase